MQISKTDTWKPELEHTQAGGNHPMNSMECVSQLFTCGATRSLVACWPPASVG